MEPDTEHSMKTQVTNHASARGQQRGIRRSDRDVVFHYGDREAPVGSGCYSLRISSRQLRLLITQGAIPPQLGHRCARVVLITDGSRVITNYKQDL